MGVGGACWRLKALIGAARADATFPSPPLPDIRAFNRHCGREAVGEVFRYQFIRAVVTEVYWDRLVPVEREILLLLLFDGGLGVWFMGI